MHGGLNTYGYVKGNPLIYVDPTGESAAAATPGIVIAIGIGIAIHNQNNNIPVENDPPINWPDELGPRLDPWKDTTTGTLVPSNSLPPQIPDACETAYTQEIEQCNSTCNNFVSKTACHAKAKLKRWICKGAKKPKWPDDTNSSEGDSGYWGL